MKPIIKIKFVRAANMWLKLTITFNDKGQRVFKREWFDDKPTI